MQVMAEELLLGRRRHVTSVPVFISAAEVSSNAHHPVYGFLFYETPAETIVAPTVRISNCHSYKGHLQKTPAEIMQSACSSSS